MRQRSRSHLKKKVHRFIKNYTNCLGLSPRRSFEITCFKNSFTNSFWILNMYSFVYSFLLFIARLFVCSEIPLQISSAMFFYLGISSEIIPNVSLTIYSSIFHKSIFHTFTDWDITNEIGGEILEGTCGFFWKFPQIFFRFFSMICDDFS